MTTVAPTPSPAVLERIGAVAVLLERERHPLSSERRLQEAIAETFRRCRLAFEREVHVGPGDIVDFFVSVAGEAPAGIAVEVKISGGRRDIYGQCARYCAHAGVSGLVLATAKPGALPATIAGKPARVVNLGRAWL